MSSGRPLRVVAYSHDSYGLGHVRRSLSVVAALVRREPRAEALCVTGAPAADLFGLPPRCDLVKLPCLTKAADGSYCPRSLSMSFAELVALRAGLISAALRAFRPDVVLVDHVPAGPGDELLAVFRGMHGELARTRVVLGLRDIIDAPHRVRAQMSAAGTFEVLREHYDEILVYGVRQIFDVGATYHLPDDLCARTSYVGVACRPPGAGPARRRERRPVLVATAGGGGDGFALLHAFVAALRGPLVGEPCSATVVTGPLMAPGEVRALRAAARRDPRIRVKASTRDMPGLLARADLVVGMGGYNTVYEALVQGRRLLTLPRTHPRLEQLERCRRLESLGMLTTLTETALEDPVAMAGAIRRALAADPPGVAATPLRFDGAERAAERLLEGLGAVRTGADEERPAVRMMSQ